MATIAPASGNPPGGKGETVKWANIATGDTLQPYTMGGFTGLAGCVQFSGTFGGATVGIEMSNNGSAWQKVADAEGVEGVTEARLLEFSISAQMIRPYISGGTGDTVDVDVVLRG